MGGVLVGCADSAPREGVAANRSSAVTSQEPYRIVSPPFVEGAPSHLWVFVRLNRDLPQTTTQDGLEQDGRQLRRDPDRDRSRVPELHPHAA